MRSPDEAGESSMYLQVPAARTPKKSCGCGGCTRKIFWTEFMHLVPVLLLIGAGIYFSTWIPRVEKNQGVHCVWGAVELPHDQVQPHFFCEEDVPILIYATTASRDLWVHQSGHRPFVEWATWSAKGPDRITPYPHHFATLPHGRVALLAYIAPVLELYILTNSSAEWTLASRSINITAAPWDMIYVPALGSLVFASQTGVFVQQEAAPYWRLAFPSPFPQWADYEGFLLNQHPVALMVNGTHTLAVLNGYLGLQRSVDLAAPDPQWDTRDWGLKVLDLHCAPQGGPCAPGVVCDPTKAGLEGCRASAAGKAQLQPRQAVCNGTVYLWGRMATVRSDVYFVIKAPPIIMAQHRPNGTFSDCQVPFQDNLTLQIVGYVFLGISMVPIGLPLATGIGAKISQRRRAKKEAASRAAGTPPPGISPAPPASPRAASSSLAAAADGGTSPWAPPKEDPRAPPTFSLFLYFLQYLLYFSGYGIDIFWGLYRTLLDKPGSSALSWAIRMPMYLFGGPDDWHTGFIAITAIDTVLATAVLAWLPLLAISGHAFRWALERLPPAPGGGPPPPVADQPQPQPQPQTRRLWRPTEADVRVVRRFGRRGRCGQLVLIVVPSLTICVGFGVGQVVLWCMQQLRPYMPPFWLSLFKSALMLCVSTASKTLSGWLMGLFLEKGSLLHTRFIQLVRRSATCPCNRIVLPCMPPACTPEAPGFPSPPGGLVRSFGRQSAYATTLSQTLNALQVPKGHPTIEAEIVAFFQDTLLQFATTVGLMEALNWVGELALVVRDRWTWVQPPRPRPSPKPTGKPPVGGPGVVGLLPPGAVDFTRWAIRMGLNALARSDPTPNADWKPLIFLFSVLPFYLFNAPAMGMMLPVIAIVVVLSFRARGALFARARAPPEPQHANAAIFQGVIFTSVLPVVYIICILQAASNFYNFWQVYDPSYTTDYVAQITQYYQMACVMITSLYFFLLLDRVVCRMIHRSIGKGQNYLQYCLRPNLYGRVVPRNQTALPARARARHAQPAPVGPNPAVASHPPSPSPHLSSPLSSPMEMTAIARVAPPSL
ncbi:hypothetical protein PAPYR_1169 [Paratrimastix pyriformis]|uniref:Uncharacterized protein n=1 Tax=Paratrimastix pyriformis TaxID=342808 RepID=A0ABQ8USA8_9EUKA|nr:hypothetical protein PAPYR_1169 [Paratrimastix pyriformis]